MSNAFYTIQKRIRRQGLITALIISLCSGALAGGGAAIACKLLQKKPHLPLCAGLGAALALITLAILIPLLLPNERRLARRLDRTLKLPQKVQTSVEFQAVNSMIATLQREDTEQILAKAPLPRPSVGTWCVRIVMPLLALAVICTACVLPVQTDTPSEPPAVVVPDPDFALSDWQALALQNLIDDVKSSDLQDPPKADVVAELEGLLVTLRAATKESEMKRAVVASIVNTVSLIDTHNTYDLVANALLQSTQDGLKTLGTGLSKPDVNQTLDALDAIRATLNDPAGSSVLGQLITALDIANRQNEAQTDPLSTGFVKFSMALAAIHANAGATPEDTALATGRAFGDLTDVLLDELFAQQTNESVRDMIRNRLMQIFNLSREDLPPETQGSSPNNGEDPVNPRPDDTLHSGGHGSGDLILGGNDEIYDPETGTHVSYGEVIQRYWAKVSGHMLGTETPEEIEAILNDYFAALLSESKN